MKSKILAMVFSTFKLKRIIFKEIYQKINKEEPVKRKTFLILITMIVLFSFMGYAENFKISREKTLTKIIEDNNYTYSIFLDGTADMDNTLLRGNGFIKIGFQPNISVEIENIGKNLIQNPFVMSNGKRDWRSIDKIVKEAIKGANNYQERLMMLYEFVRKHKYHGPIYYKTFPGERELHDPVKYLNSYGCGICDDSAKIGMALAMYANLTREFQGVGPKGLELNGHLQTEITVEGRPEFIDFDENTFYLDENNQYPLGVAELEYDHYNVIKEYVFGPIFKSWENSEKAAALFGSDDKKFDYLVYGYKINYSLRPYEKIVFRWDNTGKTPGTTEKPVFFGNSYFEYTPKLDKITLKYAGENSGIEIRGKKFWGVKKGSYIVFNIKSPWPIVGAKIDSLLSTFKKRNVSISIKKPDSDWVKIWENQKGGKSKPSLILDKALKIKTDLPCYSYKVLISLNKKGSPGILEKIKIHTDILVAPFSLPRLNLGENIIKYSDENPGERKVQITYKWRESNNINPPQAPALIFPKDKEKVKRTTIDFEWSKIEGCDYYELNVSKYKDFKIGYRPSLNIIVKTTKFGNPNPGIFNPGVTYYWRVRARKKEGIWSKWSKVREFSWEGPMPPENTGYYIDKGRVFLKWEPNLKMGTKPVKYEVYASNLKGFKPSKADYTTFYIGKRKANFVGETTKTEMLVVSDSAKTPNKTFYRIIAVDRDGIRSGASRMVELEHPFIYSLPPKIAKVGKRYYYKIKTLKSLGDLQYRDYRENGYGLWEKEAYTFSLLNGPKWLKLDKEKAVLYGIPSKKDKGKYLIEIKAEREYPYELTKNDKRSWPFLKDSEKFKKFYIQRYILEIK